MVMARCQRCKSRSAMKGYCPDCASMDPFPWNRRAMYTFVLAACVCIAVIIVLAAR
jgi:hypothetical protein